ncbi:MAG: carbamoyl phosphate synthase small subunit [Spirochaetaceae bacterium]|jgi:carbamoylphosphate synthase small subunit|nr:carbamoyl phosphate synthase small subunit [Spirochaetaceae bacterium]
MMKKKNIPARLVLEDGAEFQGWSFGKARSGAGELVFTTGMTGYPQALTDPSFCGQILMMTYPLVGNYGVPLTKTLEPHFDEHGIPVHFESDTIQVAGLVVAEHCEEPSHFASGASLAVWLEKNNVPAICGIDTRALTQRLREQGVMRGKIIVDGKPDVPLDSGYFANPVAEVSCSGVTVYRQRGASGASSLALDKKRAIITQGGVAGRHGRLQPCLQSDIGDSGGGRCGGVSPAEGVAEDAPGAAGAGGRLPPPAPLRIVLIDCGAKANILRCLLARGVELIRVPWNHDLGGIDYDGIFLSNGPGDPKSCGKTIATVRRAFARGKPIFGICLGNQIMALAAGGDTYKLPYGHRAQNQPCVDVKTGKCYITSQNHGYAVRAESLPKTWETWFVNANDNTVEGVRSLTGPFSAVQFHPEGCPGPRDTEYLIDNFLADCRRET